MYPRGSYKQADKQKDESNMTAVDDSFNQDNMWPGQDSHKQADNEESNFTATDEFVNQDMMRPGDSRCTTSDTSEQNNSVSGHKKSGKYFFYDSPLSEETGVWIPVSVPPMSEAEREDWNRGISFNGDFFPEGDFNWNQLFEGEKELTMWDVVSDMLLAARGKVSALASGDVHRCRISWMSNHLLEQAWKEMAQTLTEVNLGSVKEIIEAEPPKWLADSVASACMLCNVRFHPIMCSRY